MAPRSRRLPFEVQLEKAREYLRVRQLLRRLRPAVGGENGRVEHAVSVDEPGGTLVVDQLYE